MNVAVQPSVAKACATRNQIDSVYAGWGRSEGVRSIKEGGNVETLVCDTAGRTVPRGNRLTSSRLEKVFPVPKEGSNRKGEVLKGDLAVEQYNKRQGGK